MQAFEDWVKSEPPEACYEDCECLKIGWKAALEWIKEEGVICDGDLAGKLIKEELEDEQYI